MNNKLSITYLILIIAPLFFGCRGAGKEENKKNLSPSTLNLHAGDEKYVAIDTKESVVTWKGDNVIGLNGHTGFVHISKGELVVENGELRGGTVEVDMNTIEDEKHDRDNGLIDHLKDPDFFDVNKFPFSTIAITRVASINAEDKEITGNLTIKGITHPVSFPVKMEMKDGIVKANGKLVIDRTKWDVRYKSGKFFGNLKDQAISDDIEFDMKIVAKQYRDSLAKASLLKAEISKETATEKIHHAVETGAIYSSASVYHNVLHEFTHLVAMRDFCNKTLWKMRANGEVNKKLSKELERELIKAKAELTSSKFNGLKIELELYEIFLKQINERFRDKC